MRTIRFRGIDCCTGLWVYGFLHSQSETDGIGHCGQIHTTKDGKLQNVLVKGETIGEFTGVKDKNGQDVYEGDIVRYRLTDERYKRNPRFKNLVIGYNANSGCFEAGGIYWERLFPPKLEVIGNIHQNPELLEK